MRAASGLLRPVSEDIRLAGRRIERLAAHRLASTGLALVPEGRQVFAELSVRDNLLLGAANDDLFKIIAALRDTGITMLLVDQMAAQALGAADRGYVLETGRIVRSEAAAKLLRDPMLEAAYLGGQQAAE